MVTPGSAAPDFALADEEGNDVSLEGLRGSRFVLLFYPLDFSPVCTDQLALYDRELATFEGLNARLFGVSVDSAYCHKAFKERLGINIPLLSDFEPKGAAARAFGVYLDERGFSARALIVVDERGVVEWSHQTESPAHMPDPGLLVEALGGSVADTATTASGS